MAKIIIYSPKCENQRDKIQINDNTTRGETTLSYRLALLHFPKWEEILRSRSSKWFCRATKNNHVEFKQWVNSDRHNDSNLKFCDYTGKTSQNLPIELVSFGFQKKYKVIGRSLVKISALRQKWIMYTSESEKTKQKLKSMIRQRKKININRLRYVRPVSKMVRNYQPLVEAITLRGGENNHLQSKVWKAMRKNSNKW